jgi:hypothetical protein
MMFEQEFNSDFSNVPDIGNDMDAQQTFSSLSDDWAIGNDFSNVPDIGNDWDAQQTFSPWSDSGDSVVGSDMEFVRQTTDFTCAVVSQEMVLHDFGIDVSESQLVYDATSNGWLTNDGTSISDMGNLLEHYGVPTHTNHNGDIASLVDELAHGHKVIVALDADELWEGPSFWQQLTGTDDFSKGHALVVSGLDFSDENNPQVIVNDPGDPNGGGKHYPLNHFLESWNDSNCTYVATDNAPQDLASHPQLGAKFDPQTEMYSTPESWINTVGDVAGVAAAIGTACVFDGVAPEVAVVSPDFVDGVCSIIGSVASDVTNTVLEHVVNDKPLDFTPVWETFDDASRNQLFMEI